MILIDTNVLSELIKTDASTEVTAWFTRQPVGSLFVSAITEAELRYGTAILAPGKRRTGLMDAVNNTMTIDFRDRILPFDSFAATAYSEIAAERRRIGRPMSQSDAQIAAIARVRGIPIATRNTADFEFCGIEIINPWTSRH